MYYKLGQLGLITNYGRHCYKLGQLHYYKLGQVLLQIGAAITNQGKLITKEGNCYKLGQVLQIRAIITNCGIEIYVGN